MKTDAELLSEARDIMQDFVEKCDSGRARSVKTYAKCKAFLTEFDPEPTVAWGQIGPTPEAPDGN